MVNFALLNDFGYQSPTSMGRDEPAQIGATSEPFQADPRFENIEGMRSLALGMRNMFDENEASSSASALASSNSQQSGFDSAFNFAEYGKQQDAKAQANGGSSDETQQADERTVSADQDQQPSQEIVNLTAYQSLRSKGFSHGQIYAGQSLGFSNEEMLENAKTSGGKGDAIALVPEGKLQEFAARERVAEMMQDSELRTKMNEGEMAQNGPQAVSHGVYASYGAAQMVGSEMLRA